MSPLNKAILMTVSCFGALTLIGGIIGTARKWWREGIDLEFLAWVTFLYCICGIVDLFCGDKK